MPGISATPHSNGDSVLSTSTVQKLGTSTAPLGSSQAVSSIISIGGHLFPLSPVPDGVVVAGSTLLVGNPAITILGTPLALESSALVIGTSTIPVPNPAMSPSPGIGGLVLSAINGGPNPPTVVESAGFSQAENNSTEIYLGGGDRLGLQPMALVLVVTTSFLALF